MGLNGMSEFKLIGIGFLIDASNFIRNNFDGVTRSWEDDDGVKQYQHIVSGDKDSLFKALSVEFPEKDVGACISFLFDQPSADNTFKPDFAFRNG